MHNRREFSKLVLCSFGSGALASGVTLGVNHALADSALEFNHTRSEIYNRGRPPKKFLKTLVQWGKVAPDEVFTPNENYDVFSHVNYKLGPWKNLRHRKAVMLEVLRVLGGFESSWSWNAGVDVGKTEPNTACREEAGLFQCSGNSMNFHENLRQYLHEIAGKSDCQTFIETTKKNHSFAVEYCARLLRYTVRHHGPLKRKVNDPSNPRKSSLHPYLSQEAVEEFERLLS